MKINALIIITFLSCFISCSNDVSKCLKLRDKPFLTQVYIEEYDGEFVHSIMVNGCSSDYESLMDDALKNYIDTCQSLPIRTISFMHYNESNYKYEFENEYHTLCESIFLAVNLETLNQKDTLVIKSILTFHDCSYLYTSFPCYKGEK